MGNKVKLEWRSLVEAIIDASDNADDAFAIDGRLLVIAPSDGAVRINLRKLVGSLEPSTSPDMREVVEALEDYAREATKAITGLVGGGSELFGKQIGDIYTADLEYCVARIRNRFADGHEAKVALSRAETNLRHWREECGKLHAQVRSLTGGSNG